MNQPTNPFQDVIKKLDKLRLIEQELLKVKQLYEMHEQIMSEVLPYFVDVFPDHFEVRRELTIGSRKYRLSPHFYDEKKLALLAKQWKSTCLPTFTIE